MMGDHEEGTGDGIDHLWGAAQALSHGSGVGKTRLALEIAHDLRAGFADGLAWIDLTALRDPSLVPQMVAQALGLREQADRPFSQQVRAFLQDKQCLLLLDNFEQVLSAADPIAPARAG